MLPVGHGDDGAGGSGERTYLKDDLVRVGSELTGWNDLKNAARFTKGEALSGNVGGAVLGGAAVVVLAVDALSNLATLGGKKAAIKGGTALVESGVRQGSELVEQALRGSYRALGERGVRNTVPLTAEQISELRTAAGQIGLGPCDIQFVRTPSAYSDMLDVIMVGPNVLRAPAAEQTGKGVLERLSPRAVLAHEAGHMTTSRAGKAAAGGSLADEVQASLVGREMRGLNKVEKYQLLRDAVERARSERNLRGPALRQFIAELPAFRSGN